MRPEEKPTPSQLWLLAAILCGFGGFAMAAFLTATDPSWCSQSFVGCMGAIFLFAAVGWLLGFGASVLALKNTGGWRIVSWIVLTWNALGLLVCIVLVLMIAFRS